MSYVKIKPNLFLGVPELNKMRSFTQDEGYRSLLLKNSGSFGLLRYSLDPTFNNFKVVQDVIGSGNFKIENESFAIDSSGNMITQRAISGVAVPDTGVWQWVKISHTYSPIERGTVSIDANGNLTGVGTSFLSLLRGAPDFPSKIKFPNSSKNQLEYEVVEVLGDTTAILAGSSFKAESDLKWEIVGTFTPGHVPVTEDKFPLQYDSCTLELIPEVTTNTAPSKTEGEEFYIARIKNNGGTLIIQDKRTEFWKSQGEFNLTNIIKTANPLIGVESVKWKNSATTRDENLVQIGWGLRTTGWTLDAPSRAITFSTSQLNAGKYKSTSQFSDDELDGWRVYFTDGSYSEVHTSKVQGTSITCTLKEVDPSKLTVGDELIVVPAVDKVEIRATSEPESTSGGGGIPVGLTPVIAGLGLIGSMFLIQMMAGIEGTVGVIMGFALTMGLIKNVFTHETFTASTGFGILKLPIPSSTYKYNIQYRYIKGGEASQWIPIPSDLNIGYYDESSFDSNGKLKDTTNRKIYTSHPTMAFIELVRASDSYIDFIGAIATGDKYGYDTFELDNGSPVVTFEAGMDSFVQRCTGVRGESPFTANHIIGLKVTDKAKVGNSFTFIFNVGIVNAGFNLDIQSGYQDAANPGSRIKRFSEEDFDYPFLEGKAVIIKCIYNGAAWEAFILEEDPTKINDIKMVSNINITDFPQGKAAAGTKHQGWAIADGTNGTMNLADRFIVGFNKNGAATPSHIGVKEVKNYGAIGNTGGKDEVKLLESEMPIHSHNTALNMKSSGQGYAEQGSQDPAPSVLGMAVPQPTIQSAGGGQVHENRPAYIVVGFLQRIKQV